jgi:hypothetical protein
MEQFDVDPQSLRGAAPIADDYTPDAREKNGRWQHLVKYCLDLFDRIKGSEYREKKRGEIKDSYAAYEQEDLATDDPWPGASNITLPLTAISTDNLEPRIVAGLIGKRPYVRFEMESEQRPPQDVQLVESWYNQELEEVVKIERVGREISHTLMLEGTVFPLATYDSDERVIRDFATIEDAQNMPELAQGMQPQMVEAVDPMTGQPAMVPGGQPQIADINGILVDAQTGEPIVIEKQEALFEGGKVDFAEFNDVFILDDAEDWEKTPVLRMVYPTYAELMQASKKGTKGYLPKNIGPWLCREQTSGSLDEDSASPRQASVGIEVSKEVIPCLECSIRYIYRAEDQEEKEITDFTEERVVALIAIDKRILLRMALLRELNWKNEHLIKRLRMFPERGRAYGTTIYGKCKAIQKGASKTFNMAINIAEIVLIPWFFYSKRAGMKYEGKLYPGLGVEVDDPSAVVFPKFNINPDQMFQYLTIWEGYWERLLSIGNLQVGLPSTEAATATEVMATIQEGNVKHNYQVATLRDEFLGLFTTIYDLYYQHMPLTKTFYYNGQQTPIPRQAMKRPFRFKLTGSTEFSNKLIERRETEDFFKMTANDPLINPITIREDLCRSYNRTDTGSYVDPQAAQIVAMVKQFPEAVGLFQQAVQQAQQMAMEAQAQVQGGGPTQAGGGPPEAPQGAPPMPPMMAGGGPPA